MSHQHGANCQHGHSSPSVAPEDYFKNLRTLYSTSRVLFWMELLSGQVLSHLFDRCSLGFMNGFTCQIFAMIIATATRMLSFDFIPLCIRPIISGLFVPILVLFFFNFNVVVGIAQQNVLLLYFMAITLILYALVAFRGSGTLGIKVNQEETLAVHQMRPYLNNPHLSCAPCSILKPFRSMHCPYCKQCIPKFTRHSLVFGICIGASNQLLAMLFFGAMCFTETALLYSFMFLPYGALTRLMFYSLNGCIAWMSFVEGATILVLNICNNLTEQEIKMWPSLAYLNSVPQRKFLNSMDGGVISNLIQALLACFGMNGFESNPLYRLSAENIYNFPELDQSRHCINWSQAFLYLVPMVPNHPNRTKTIEMMRREEPRMIEAFRAQKMCREEVLRECADQHLNEFQIQEKVMVKMQMHMMKIMPKMMPTPEQQKAMQLQMLAHMKKELVGQPDFVRRFQQIELRLEKEELFGIEANMEMRKVQRDVMERKMKKVVAERERMLKEKGQREDEEERLGVVDEDL